ncbi:hypothetical protein AGRHK599_LOCUS1201 [Rhizobium rhizogenes]|uniref:Uncharacterized protein n=1 Tax=Rhizobium rhizogenes TaxID=359 RepID=A0AAN2DCK0_RHIRH|nr:MULTISPECIES: hypothetical protein [Rhizobium/Agrobacterium group]AQS61796.1 hypothetical protein B0909_05680 [Rhizobium rhizogenes]MCZ7442975.1 hypothetical protein [Rhizobium rhizogenes]NSZ78963.1 hypothetical protein [Agrobacterium tumefaciens]OAM65757.1 hypothetical protein A8L48_22445 [Rhizobium rhizogenes]CAD0211176.1 hypothetical protein AGRHK599_LOCUS1201 [Rhizobium rhizogenes]
MTVNDISIQRLRRLIRRLDETHPLSKYQLDLRKSSTQIDFTRRYSEDEIAAYLEAHKPTPVGRGEPANAKDDLDWQVDLFNARFTDYLLRAEWPPPNISWRITVILRRVKRLDLEAAFLASYFRHFWSERGSSTDTKLGQRAVKIGIDIPGVPDSTPLPVPDYDELPILVDGVATIFFSPEDFE